MKQNTIVDQSNDEISLKELILKFRERRKFLLTKWKTILIVCILGALSGLTYSLTKKPVYIAQLSFALDDTKVAGGLSAYSGIASQFGLDIGSSGGGAFSGDNLIELMKSRSMIEKALLTPININGNNKTLAERYIDFNELRQRWKDKPELANTRFLPNADRSKFSLTQDSLLGEFHKDIMANILSVDKVDKKLSIILVTAKSKNELFSKYFIDILADDVSEFYIETKTKKFSQNVNILQHQYDSVRYALDKGINNVAASIDVNPSANPNKQVLRAPAQHHQVDVQVNTAMIAELVKNLEIAKVSLRNETPLIQVIDKPILPLQKEKVGMLKGTAIGAVAAFFLATFGIALKKIYQTILL